MSMCVCPSVCPDVCLYVDAARKRWSRASIIAREEREGARKRKRQRPRACWNCRENENNRSDGGGRRRRGTGMSALAVRDRKIKRADRKREASRRISRRGGGDPTVLLRELRRANTRARNSAESALSTSLRRGDLREGFNFDLDVILSFKRMINTRELHVEVSGACRSLPREGIYQETSTRATRVFIFWRGEPRDAATLLALSEHPRNRLLTLLRSLNPRFRIE